MDAALAAAKKSSFRTRVVTLAGDVVNAGGSLTGGSRQQKEAGFLSRGKEIDEQEQKAGVLRRELLGYQELLEEHEGTLKVITTNWWNCARTCSRRKSAKLSWA